MTSDAETDGLSRTNFFISYTQSDLEAASWIAWELERAGFTYRMQGDDFPPGSRFLTEMRRWLQAESAVRSNGKLGNTSITRPC
jgi:hypothetical protein